MCVCVCVCVCVRERERERANTPMGCSFVKCAYTHVHPYLHKLHVYTRHRPHIQLCTKHVFFLIYTGDSCFPPSQLRNIASHFKSRLKYTCSVMLHTVPYLAGLSTFIFAATVYSVIQEPSRSERTQRTRQRQLTARRQ